MFEIGNNLRESRLRQHLELDDVVAATLIRRRYVEALEQERFELLPDGFYRRGFLRRYAEFLGLDADTFVQEYDLRFAAAPAEVASEPRIRRAALGRSLARTRAPLLALAGVAVAGIVVWQLAGSSGAHLAAPPAPLPRAHAHAKARHPVHHHRIVVRHVAAKPPSLVLTAARGPCWISVQLGSANGPTIATETLQQGQRAVFGLAHALYLRLGAPGNLDVRIGKRSVTASLPAGTGDVVAAANGLRAAP